jgi:carboxyl-terminal processing protease
MSHRNLLLLLATAAVSYACYIRAEQNPYARYVAAGYSVIDRWSLVETPDQQLFEGAMQGMVRALKKQGDEYSAFVSETHCEEYCEDMRQEFGSIAVRIPILGEPPLPTVISPLEPSTPASKANLQLGDRILAIDGTPTAGLTMHEILRQMRGPVGEPVSLTIERDAAASPLTVAVTRQVITVESILGDFRDNNGNWNFRLADDPRLGYIRIDRFGDKTLAELTHVLADLTQVNSLATDETKAIEAVILDVRDNSGGALDAVVGISDLFLRAGLPIVSTRGRDQIPRDRFVATGRSGYTKIPLAVLVNNESASASEILAACLQDHQRATIVGQRTYGKGTVQRVMHIESGRSRLKLTSATYWRPSGQNIHRMPGATAAEAWGVKPNLGFQVELDELESLSWRHYRSRRDLVDNPHSKELLEKLRIQYGELPGSYRDRVLDRAVLHLQAKLSE